MIDTATKRGMMLNFGYPGFETIISPSLDGSMDENERRHRVGLYAALVAAAEQVIGVFYDAIAHLRTTLGMEISFVMAIGRRALLPIMTEQFSHIDTSDEDTHIDRRASIEPEIEKQSRFSVRISRSTALDEK